MNTYISVAGKMNLYEYMFGELFHHDFTIKCLIKHLWNHAIGIQRRQKPRTTMCQTLHDRFISRPFLMVYFSAIILNFKPFIEKDGLIPMNVQRALLGLIIII